MKKKLIILIASCMMVFAACSGSEGKEAPTPEPTATSTPTPEPTATSTPTPEPTATSTPTPEPVVTDTYEKGIITENGFESKWMNLRFTMPGGAELVSQQELDALMQQGAEMFYGDTVDYASLTNVTEMMAKNADGSNVILQAEKLPLLYSFMTEENYLEVVAQNLETAYSSAGLEFLTDEAVYEVEIGGERYIGLTTGVKYPTGELLYQDYIVRKKDGRMIYMVFSYTDATMESAKRLAECFGSYDSEPVVLPEPTTVPVEGPFDLGTVTESGYENAWLNMRFAAPEGVIMSNQSVAGTVMVQATWPEGLPVVQIITEKSEKGLEAYFENLKTSLESMAANGLVYQIDETLYAVEIGGQQYVDMATSVESNGMTVYQEYSLREQDGYIIGIVFSYKDGYEEAVNAALDAFAPY